MDARAPDGTTAMRQGIEFVQLGRLSEAATAFAEAVAFDPESAAAHVNLAYALQQCDRADEAIDHLKCAATIDDGSFDAQYMLGLALEGLNRQHAIHHMRRAIAIRRDLPDVYGDLCRLLAQEGRSNEAKLVLKDALASHPDDPGLLRALGNLRLAEGDVNGALAAYDRLRGRVDDMSVWSNRARALRILGRTEEAITGLETAISLSPLSASVQAELGRALDAVGRSVDACRAYRKAVELEPGNADFLNQLGAALQAHGDTNGAIDCFIKAIASAPDMPGPRANLGLAYYEQGRLVEAIVKYREALAIRPIAEAHDNLAIALQKQGALDEAIAHYQEALRLAPDNKNTRCNLAAALAEGGQPRESAAAYRQIIALHPDHFVAHSNLLFVLSVDPATPHQAYLEEVGRYGSKVAARSTSSFVNPLPRRDGRLRVGLVSGDLRSHPVGFFLEGMLDHLDRSRFELFAYSTIAYEDALTARVKPRFATWRSLKGMNDEEAAQQLRDDRIDVLFDLAGHTGDNRLPVFAMRAAPVQVSWLGYFASTGVSAMDYVLADEVCVPLGGEKQFTERVWRVPRTRLCYTPPRPEDAPDVAPLPAGRRGNVTFGCYQRLSKINDTVLVLWGRVMAALPQAHLRLQASQTGRAHYVDQMLERLVQIGVAADRVVIAPPMPRELYLRSYSEVDIVLDTFPFNGGTTTCEALWMGVPTLTIEGDSMISRQGAALLLAADMPDWVAVDDHDFVAKAVAHSSDLPRLASLRASLRERVRNTPLFDTKVFATRWADAVEGMAGTRSGNSVGQPTQIVTGRNVYST